MALYGLSQGSAVMSAPAPGPLQLLNMYIILILGSNSNVKIYVYGYTKAMRLTRLIFKYLELPPAGPDVFTEQDTHLQG